MSLTGVAGSEGIDKKFEAYDFSNGMNAITYTAARKNLAETIETVVSDRNRLIITKDDMSVVMMSLEDYESLQETAYLLRSPTNARRLLDSINELDEGKGTEREIIE